MHARQVDEAEQLIDARFDLRRALAAGGRTSKRDAGLAAYADAQVLVDAESGKMLGVWNVRLIPSSMRRQFGIARDVVPSKRTVRVSGR